MPRAHQCRGPISAQGPSIPRAHGGLYMLRAHPCRGPIPAQGPSILKGHGVIHTQGPSMPHPCQKPTPGQGLYIPRAHVDPSIPRVKPRAHPCLEPIHP